MFTYFYRNQAEMAHTCRGTINLANAFIHTEDSNTIVISNSGSSTYYLKATSEVERQRWVTALELAKAEAVKMQESGNIINVYCVFIIMQGMLIVYVFENETHV